MALVFFSKLDGPDVWTRALRDRLPDLDVRLWPEVGNPGDVDVALVFQPPPGVLARFPHLRFIQSLGAGVDGILADPDLPDVPLCRMVDRRLTSSMVEYVLLATLRVHRRFDRFAQAKTERCWAFEPPVPPEDFAVGLLGLGELGAACAKALVGLGYKVSGWSRSPKDVRGVKSVSGEEGLDELLASSDLLIAMLPATPATRGVLNAELFSRCRPGAHLVNVGRGDLLHEPALTAALNEGLLTGATLDVFADEPLPDDHPFWRDPRIFVTPHVSGFTDPETAVDLVAENIQRLWRGQPLLHVVDRSRGY